MFKFELNSVSILKFRVAGSSGTDTTLVGTGTNLVLHVGTGTTLSWYRYHFGSGEWYRYHFALVPVPFGSIRRYLYHRCSGTDTTLRDCTEMAYFALFHSLFFHNSLLFHPTSKPTWNPSKTTPQTLIIVV